MSLRTLEFRNLAYAVVSRWISDADVGVAIIISSAFVMELRFLTVRAVKTYVYTVHRRGNTTTRLRRPTREWERRGEVRSEEEQCS